MNDTQRTSGPRRGLVGPILTGLLTVTAAAALIISLGMSGGEAGSGSAPSAGSPSAPEPTATPDASATDGPTASPTPGAASGEGEFGPIHSMEPEEAFANGQTCTVENATVNGAPTDLTWAVAFPEGWSTNGEGTGLRSSCTLFGPGPFEAPEDQAIPDTVAIVTDVIPGGDFVPDGASHRAQAYTVDDVAAVRYEIHPGDGGFVASSTVVWIIGIAGNLPGAGNDQPYVAFQVSSDDPSELAARTTVLDRMVATLDIGA